MADHVAGASGRDDRLWGGRYRGTPLRTEDHGEGLLPRCSALLEEARHPVFRPEMGCDDAVGPGARESASVSAAISHRTVLAHRQSGRRRHKSSIDWVWQMMKQVRRSLPERRLVLVVDGDFAAVSLALACVKQQVVMVSRLRWDAALYHPPAPQPTGKGGPKPLKGKRQRSWQGWVKRSDTPWERRKWAGTGASANACWSSRTPRCGTLRDCLLSRSVMWWSAILRGNSG